MNENEVILMCAESHKNIPLASPIFDKEMEDAALNALRNERFVLGEDVFKFEEEFARYIGTRFAVSTSSGTNALQIAFLALGIEKGNEVVTSAFSFIASANAVVHAGAIPVFADIDAETYNVDPKAMKLRVTKQTRVLLPVHLYGYPCDMREIMNTAEELALKVVEDACQAHGAMYASKKAGVIGDIGCFSFYPSKNMTVCGDGGMIVTNNESVAKLAAKLRDCGRKSQYEHDIVGYTSRLNTVNAAVGRVQLRRLDEWNKKRVKLAAKYDKLLAGISEVNSPPRGGSKVKPVYHLYVVTVKKRDELRAHLQEKGISTGVHYPLPIPMQPVYKQMCKFKIGDYPISVGISKKCLSLPIHPSMGTDEVEYVCDKIKEFY